MIYRIFKWAVSIFFTILNKLIGGNLPPFGCASVIVEDVGQYLVLRRPEGKIVFPGGFMRWGEHPTQTAKREGSEETGLHLRIGDAIGYYSSTSHRVDVMSTLNITYCSEVVGGELHTSVEGQPFWADEQFLRAKMNFYYLSMLDDYLAYKQQKRATNVPLMPSST